MIRYAMTCDHDHAFESWFQSVGAFDSLVASGHVTCAQCGSPRVTKSLMSPTIRPARSVAATPETRPAPTALSTPETPIEIAFAKMRKQIEDNSEYVGLDFAAEARAIHDGDAPGRSIYGEAHCDDARKLIEDGIAVAPLPFMPQRRVN
jgi:hypothetical protein